MSADNSASQTLPAPGRDPKSIDATVDDQKPDRLRQSLRHHDRQGEKAIAAGQAAISCFVLLLHLLAQLNNNLQSANPWVIGTLGALIATSVLRLCLANLRELPERLTDLLTVFDIAIFLALIWTYQLAYGHPAGAVLKSPSFALLFVLVALRALRFHPRPILIAGTAATVGWSGIVALSVLRDGTSAIIHDYSRYLTSHDILLGAELEKGVALAALTVFLAVATQKARNMLSQAAHAADYADALESARCNLEEAKGAKQKAEAALAELDQRDAERLAQNERFNIALENMSQALCMFDSEKRLVVCNDRYVEMYGLAYDLAEPGTPFRKILEHRIQSGIYSGEEPEAYIEERLAAVDEAEASTKIQELTDGRVISISHRPMPDGGWVATHDDITDLQRIEEQITHMAHHDALTDLPNRTLLGHRIEEALARARRGEKFAVLCLDLDQFKSVNDTLGHPIGDELLKAVAERLARCTRETDTIARLGGDEFAIVQASAAQPRDATALADRISEAIKEPFDLGEHQVVVDTSIGIAVAPDDGGDPHQLLKNADMALYRAKGDGRGLYRFFEPEMDARMKARRELELDLRKALEAGEFELHYQPLLSLRSKEVSGFEALLRWRHPERGLIAPLEFIPLAEEIGLIVPLGEWVIRQACAEATNWPDDVKVAVNLSPVQFKSGNLVPAVVNALAASGVAADRLELEITESVLLQDNEATLNTLHQLRRLGVRIAMDDFGTGYSSLSYLRSFPFDKIKIDGSFIGDLSDGEDAVAIIRAVASLGNSLGMATTAEGVETEEQLRRVHAEGYTEIQGFLFSPAKPAEEITRLFFPRTETPVAKAG
ncbi:MAG: putative bifunctional diguanylate cyclase/phosphodiesterase [Methyloligellaceae bacterium]